MTVGLKLRFSTNLSTNQSKAALNQDCTTVLLMVEQLGEDWISHPARVVVSYDRTRARRNETRWLGL